MSSILGPKISSASYSQMLLIDVFAIMRNTKSHTTEARWWTYSFFVANKKTTYPEFNLL